jgi:anaerobic magnesium-protoporphyrin IX monomethyl ester cyclase
MRRNKILFIIPPYLPFDEYRPKRAGLKLPTLTPPYGVLSIISYINVKKKYDIKIFDANDSIINSNANNMQYHIVMELQSLLNDFNPDLICVSALFNTCFPHLKYLASFCKAVKPYTILLVGGGLATNLYQDLFHDVSKIDAVCFGEGEIPFKKLLKSKIHIEDSYRISPAWITQKSLQLNIQPEFDFVENLDDIPIIDFSYIDLKRYNGRSYIDKDLSSKIEVSIHTSRGCPFSCVYCSNGTVHGKKIRKMSEKRVLETIRYYINKYNLDILLIEDDHFLADKQRALHLLSEFKKFNIDLEFPNGVAVFQIDDEIAYAFNECRIKVLPLAIESGSDRVLKEIINKPLRREQIFKAVTALKKYDIRLHAFIIIGFPTETDEDRLESLNILLDTEIDWAHIFIVVPIAGSRLYMQCDDAGYLLSRNYNDYTTSKCNIKAPGVDPKEIEKYAYYMNIIVNFVCNSNFKNGRYDICEMYFKNVINHYPEQAIAHYMLYQIYIKTNRTESARHHYDLFQKIISENKFYNNIIKKLKREGFDFKKIQ